MSDLMTLRDIAALAHVQRPVVSVWRRRSRATSTPFPAVHERRAGRELFLRDEVVTWLEDTQRGNNPDVRADAAAHGLLSDGGLGDAEALSALLALRHLSGRLLAGQSRDDLLDLADEHDPDDLFLFRELDRVDELPPLATTADKLVEAAWHETSAHLRLMDARLRTDTDLARVALTDEGRRFLLGLFGPLTREVGEPAVMDPTGCAVDVLAEIASALGLEALVMGGNSAAHRLTQRQLILADVPYRQVPRGSRDWSVTGPVAQLVVLPGPAHSGAGDVEQLDLLDEVALQVDDRQLVLCFAPAATLTDPLEGEALLRRDQLLRDGYVRAIVRLPSGLRPAHVREHSALWLLGKADTASAADQRVLVGDLAGRDLRNCAGLADDLLAAWQGPAGARRRAWAHLRPVPTRDLIASSATLVPPMSPRPPASRGGADWAVALRTADPSALLADFRLEVVAGDAEEVTVAQAIERGWVRVVPGRRLSVDSLPSGSVAVIDAPTLSDAQVDNPRYRNRRTRGVDRLALLSRPGVSLTEPGDIVFATTPRPVALIDSEGGSLVQTPARILRVRSGAPIVPQTVVARINAATTGTWRHWTLSVIPEPARGELVHALDHLAADRTRLVAELATLDDLTQQLTLAVESRRLRITKENHGPTEG